jgi:hypothetical protein
MRLFLMIAATLLSLSESVAQTEGKWLRAFPVTDYMVALNDSTSVVQLEMPEGFVVPDKQLGIVYGVYHDDPAQAVQKGYGRCYLVKGVYHYFAISNNRSGLPVQAGDLLYMFLDSTGIYYGRIPQLAGHFIRFQNVYEDPFYDRYLVFKDWTIDHELVVLDSMKADIRFTGQWMKDNNDEQDARVTGGIYKGRTIFDVMIHCTGADLLRFLDYVISSPRNYAGTAWKLTETFATWVSRGPL